MALAPLAFVALCYVIGSIPVAWMVARVVTGRDIRQLGSGNVGVMNTAVSVARWAGVVVFLAEALKGMSAVWLARWLGLSDVYLALGVIAVVAGTHWSIWMRGLGGRGNTAGGAAILLIAWPAVAAYLALWAVLRMALHSAFRATRLCHLCLPVILGLVTRSWVYAGMGLGLSLIYIGSQEPESDDHSLIKARWPSLWAFVTSPRRSHPR